jgi:(2Fe-2S) ferredoxin
VERRYKVIVCRGPDCGDKRESRAVHAAFAAELAARGLGATVDLGWQSCFGRCTQGPNVLVSEVRSAAPPRFAFATLPTGVPGRAALYNGCTPTDAAEIVEQHVQRGVLVRRLIRPIGAGPGPAATPATPDPGRRSDGEG